MAYKFVHGNWGQVIGRIHEDSGSTIRGKRDDVFDKYGQNIGWSDDEGTFDVSGFKISDTRMPGLLIKEEK
jgi:hypothetical protein